MNELSDRLAQVRKDIKSLVALGDSLSDEQVEKLDGLNKQALKLEALQSAAEQNDKAEKEAADRIEREKREAVEAAVKAEQAKSRRLPFEGQAPYQSKFSDTWKYDSLDAGDTSLLIETLQSAGKNISAGAMKALSFKVAELKDNNTEESRKGVAYVKGSFKAATGIDPTTEAVGNAVIS